MTLAAVFPGQGSQYVGMGRDLFNRFAIAKETYEAASRALGHDVAALCFEGPEERLNQTEWTQPAILTTSIAVWRVLNIARHVSYVAGHSLGEITALVAGEALSLEEAVPLVHRRGVLMQEAVPEGAGKMVAIIGMTRNTVLAICQMASDDKSSVTIANYNGPDQMVVAGGVPAVDRAMALALQGGAKRAIPLPVSVPSHTPLMQGASRRLAEEIDKLAERASPAGRTLKIPLINNLAAKEVTTWPDVRSGLIAQISSPLLWEETINWMRGVGVDMFIEVGPRRVLSGLLKRIDPKLQGISVEDATGIEKIQLMLGEK